MKYFFSKKDRVVVEGKSPLLDLSKCRTKLALKKDFYLGWVEPDHLGWEWDTNDLQIYSEDFVDIRKGEITLIADPILVMPEIPTWVKEEREKGKSGDYTHYSGMLMSKKLFKPPFIVEYVGEIPQKATFLPGIWLLNDLDGKLREIDCFEAFSGRIFFSVHYGKDYAHKKYDITNLYKNLSGNKNVIRTEVYEDHVAWFCNGIKVKEYKLDSKGIEYHVLATMIVPHPRTVAPDSAKDGQRIWNNSCEWTFDHLKIYNNG